MTRLTLTLATLLMAGLTASAFADSNLDFRGPGGPQDGYEDQGPWQHGPRGPGRGDDRDGPWRDGPRGPGRGDDWDRPDHRPGFPGRPFPEQKYVERIRVQREFRGQTQINLAQLIDLRRFHGLRLKAVVMNAATRAGRGDATLCVGGCETINNVGTYMAPYRFRTYEQRVDRSAWNWSLNLRGNFFIDSIELVFVR